MTERPISTDPQVHLRYQLSQLLDERGRLRLQIPSLHAALRAAENRMKELNRKIEKHQSLLK